MNGFAALDFPCACCYIADMAASDKAAAAM
jgi:hypothetical protein